jgi:hypothetical protein
MTETLQFGGKNADLISQIAGGSERRELTGCH